MRPDLEPVERNPAELRRTAWKLVLVMVLGAAGILTAYKIKQSQKANENPDRPPIVTKITQNFSAKNQYDKFMPIYEFEDKVWFAVPVCVGQLDENKHALAMMKELQDHYADNEQVHFVLISIEGADQGVGPEQLLEASKKLDMTGPRVWFLTTTDTAKQRGFIKDKMRLGIVSKRKEGDAAGKWKFPSQLALFSRGMHLRQRYDFKEADYYQKKAEAELVKRPEVKDEEGFDKVLNAVEELKKTLYANTEFVLQETTTGSKE